jgi:hypothetical protein
MATKTTGKGTVAALAEQLIAGTNKHLTSTTQVLLVGVSYTPAQVTQQLQTLVNLRSSVDAAKATVQAKLAAEKAQMPALSTFMGALVSYVKASFGNAPDVLADFGLHPKARAQPTVQAKTAAAAKRKATRAARHTTGPKQKLSVKGDVQSIVVTPILAGQPVAAVSGSTSAPATSAGATAATPRAT